MAPCIVTCINRQYAKKLVIQLPRQKHPYHFHKQKEETFQLLDGDLEIVKDGARTSMRAGDTFLVEPSEWHKFHTLDGCVFEEISTTHLQQRLLLRGSGDRASRPQPSQDQGRQLARLFPHPARAVIPS